MPPERSGAESRQGFPIVLQRKSVTHARRDFHLAALTFGIGKTGEIIPLTGRGRTSLELEAGKAS
jgi:hypothetical protein